MESTDTHARDRVTDLADLAAGALLSEASDVEALLREAEVHKLRVAYQGRSPTRLSTRARRPPGRRSPPC